MRYGQFILFIVWLIACRTSADTRTFEEAKVHFKDVLFIVKYNFPTPVKLVWTHFSIW